MKRFDGSPKSGIWAPPKVYSDRPRMPEPDFWSYGASGSSWAVRPEAFEKAAAAGFDLEGYLIPSGELLPFAYDEREFVVFNVTECLAQLLDHERSIWGIDDETGERWDTPDEPRFRLDRLGQQIFKVPEMDYQIYSYEQGEPAPEHFRVCVEEVGLAGLVFNHLYTTDDD